MYQMRRNILRLYITKQTLIMKSANKYLSRLIRCFILLFTTLSYQSLILLIEANISNVSAQVQPSLCATPGRDGNGVTASGIINTYYPGASNSTANAGATSIRLGAINPNGATTPIAAGDLLLIIQMQGADINSSNNDSYGNGVSGGGNDTNLLTAPTITGASGNLNNANFTAGNYEYVVATGAISGGAVSIRGAGTGGGLINSYSNTPFGTQGQRTYQVIRVPQYANVSLSSTLTAPDWNGSSGGILVYDVAGNLNLNSANININGKGFRGGGGRRLSFGAAGLSAADYATSSSLSANGSKGEGTAGTPRYLIDRATITLIDNGIEGYPNGSYGRGAPGNAGGGSTDGNPNGAARPSPQDVVVNGENSGGGGGGNGGSGGLGGRSWQTALFSGGFGGNVFATNGNRLILGGGGGAGTNNDGTSESPEITPRTNGDGRASSGAPGGGMVLLRTGTVSGNGVINANGINAFNTRQDGGGGGGAGGSVIATATSASLAGLTINARGGNGGSIFNFTDPHGPGGGGGGGVIFHTGAQTTNVDGGLPGTGGDLGNPPNPILENDRNFGATPGQRGIAQTPAPIPGIRSGAECLPLLTVNKITSTPGPILKPGKATYTITVSNATNRATATNVNIADPLPASFTFDGSITPTIALNGGATRTATTNPIAGATNLDFGTFDIPGGGNVQITFTANVGTNVPDGVYQNGATATYLNPISLTPGGTLTSSYDPASSTGEDVGVGTLPPPPPPNVLSLRGVKRITNATRNGAPIAGVNFNQVIDDPTDQSDNASIWSSSPLSPLGITRIDPQLLLQTGDEVEYTIYFLADGNQPIPNVRFCDPLPLGTTLISDSFGSDSGILLNVANITNNQTNISDGDRGSYYPPVAPLPGNNVCPSQSNSTGAVLVNLGTADNTPGNNFGFIRFRVRLE